MNDTQSGWAVWRHRGDGRVVLVLLVHGAVENALHLTHPSVMRWSEELADQCDIARCEFDTLWRMEQAQDES